MIATIRLVASVLSLLAALAGAQRPRAAVPSAWYDRRLIRDLTGDGRPDTLRVVARGRVVDSLHVTLTIRGMGRELFREEWATVDDFRDYQRVGNSVRVPVDSLERIERHRLDAIFDSDGFESVSAIQWHDRWPPVSNGCDGDPRDCIAFYLRYERDTLARIKRGLPAAPSKVDDYVKFLEHIDGAPFDTALVRRLARDIRQSKAMTFSFSYGYENTRTIVWSASARRFFPIFECC